MLHCQNITKSFAGRDLFVDASFSINPGEKIGVVGRNGTGKSTLFKIILGQLSPDQGKLSKPRGYQIAALDQHIQFSKSNILDECIEQLPEDEQYDHYKAEKVLSGLGFSQEDFSKAPQLFSGGFQVRLCLAKAIVQKPNLLLLDEPTNYLDIVSIRWLKNFLKTYPNEVMIITHDRSFMDDIVDSCIGIKRKKINKIKGNSQQYYSQIQSDEELHQKTKENIDKKKKQLEDFVERFKAKASKATQAQSKLKQLFRLESLDSLEDENDLSLRFPYKEFLAKKLITIDNLGFHYSNKYPLLFSKLNFIVNPKDRIAIIGKNGKGKSTLINILAQELTPTQGTISFHPHASSGYFAQTNINRLNDNLTIVEEIHHANLNLSHTQVRSIAASMLFKGEDADKKIKVLSGGEKSRVLLGKILAQPSNLLLLDEPTKHLDIQTDEVLVNSIKNYPGALVVVTHDEMILDRLINKFVYFKNSNAQLFNGSYQDFLRKIGWDSDQEIEKDAFDKDTKAPLSYKEKKQRKSEIIKSRSQATKQLKSDILSLEAAIEESESKLKIHNRTLLQASRDQDPHAIAPSSQKIHDINTYIDQCFEQLSSKTIKLEELEQYYLQQINELER